MMIVALIWSLCELLISTPCILGDEALHKTEALIDRLRTQWQTTCPEPMYPLLSTGVNGGLLHLSLTSLQPMIKALEASILMGSGKLPARSYLLIWKVFPYHLAKSTLSPIM